METTSVFLFVAGALLVGVVLGFLLAAVRAARREATNRVELTGALAQVQLLESQVAEQRARAGEESRVVEALAPVRSTLEEMGQKVTALEKDRNTQYGSLLNQLQMSANATSDLRSATTDLTSALRSTSARGLWGELQLRRVLEVAGMLKHVDFHEQTSLPGGGQPDAMVHLPAGRRIPIDAKVPLDAHLEAEGLDMSQPEAEEKLRGARVRHAKALKAHIDELTKRDYHSKTQGDITVLFLPAESLLAAALVEEPALLDYALAKGIVPATPSNLLALMRTVGNFWAHHELAEQAEDLRAIGKELYERLGLVAKHLGTLGGSIANTVRDYNQVVGSLETRLLVTARKFGALEAPPALAEVNPDKAQVRQFTAVEFTSAS